MTGHQAGTILPAGEAITLEDAYAFLSDLHEETGWEFGIRVTASTHVAWNVELRVTPRPFARRNSDLSYLAMRVGPPEWALNEAITDMLTWLTQTRPGTAPRKCPDCPGPPQPGPILGLIE